MSGGRNQQMTLERFAALLTEMETGTLFATLARHGVTEREWARARHHWLRRAVSDVAVRRALSAELRARQTGPSALQPSSAQVAAPAPEAAAPAPARVLASFQRLAAAPSPPSPPAPPREVQPEPDATAMVDLERAIEGQKLPFREVSDADREAFRPSALQAPPVPPTDAEGGGTALVDLDAPVPASLPFSKQSVDSTVAADLDQVVAAPTLPFSGEQASLDAKVRQVVENLERYAQVVSVLAYAEDRKRALLIFGLNEASWQAATASWATRIQADPSIKSAFDALMKERRGK